MILPTAAPEGCGFPYFYGRYVQDYLEDDHLVRVLEKWSLKRRAMPQNSARSLTFLNSRKD